LGEYRGFAMDLSFDTFGKEYRVTLKGALSHTVSLGTDIVGNLSRIDNALERFSEHKGYDERELAETRQQMENAKAEVERPFPQEAELAEKTARLNEVNIELNLDKREPEIIEAEPDEGDSADAPQKKERSYER
jgi:hypothetical protein